MPELDYWESFFDPELILDKLGLDAGCGNAVEFGCGYGTFTIPAAQRVTGTVTALDLDPTMLEATRERAEALGLENIDLVARDFVDGGTGLPDGAVDYVMVFNILHGERPVELLREARRNLTTDGRLGIIHWNYDPDTPRGPPMDMRPQPGECRAWAIEAGFSAAGDLIDLPPYHYGMVLVRR